MESIFFEKQEGSLCAQHALNALLQGSYFTAVELADIARRLDEQERDVYAHAGIDSPEYLRAMQEESHNMDDSGYFSVQVISEALTVWNLALVPYMSPTAGQIRQDPTSQKAYICNYREHWFTIRKLGFQWFNLNSMLNGPELISDTYLHLFLTQLQNEGYSIFVVDGDLPNCRAEDTLKMTPVDPTLAARSSAASDQRKEFAPFSGAGNRLGGDPEADNDPDLAAAIALSRQEADTYEADLQKALELSKQEIESGDPSLQKVLANSAEDDADLQEAIRLSMTNGESSEQENKSGTSANASPPAKMAPAQVGEEANAENLRKQREAFLTRLQQTQSETATPSDSTES